MKEIWKLWKDNIYISNMGNVRGRKVSNRGDGYLRISYKNKNYRVHRLVAELFIPNTENKPQVDHINRNRSDNRVQNLRWATHSENQKNKNKYYKIKIKCKETGIIYNGIEQLPNYDINMTKNFHRNVTNGYSIKGYHYEYIN